MKRATVIFGVLVLLTAVWTAPVAAASFKAVIHENFGRRASAEPCVEVTLGLACPGSGTVQGYGNVTSWILFPADYPLVRTVTFSNGSTLVLHETPLSPSRIPGNANHPRGYGNPVFDHYAWVVAGGSGTFAHATGSGEWVNVLAGDTIVLKFSGTIDLG